ncbi:hypothetical protein K431DRAFT_315163 [Polychaeton citri CBS 116435]|uniref:Rhodopsin domain-containing protein n=1 Tax=Polychaeton citri CBS 116435 TaxID=1314669 RepID=A0A9P4Q079_9PEZI|nr:hypothetical protein K431DRAFT_315163 [Polychaeton citri CBS 116435]
MAAVAPPFFSMDSQHRGAHVVITSYSLIVYTISVGIIRLWITRDSTANFSFDDASTLLAIVFSITSYATYSKAVSPGLGSHQTTLDPSDVNDTMKLVLTSQLVGIAALWTAKLSSATLRWRIESNSSKNLSWNCKITLGVAAVWGPLCLLLTAFQCQSPAWAKMSSTTCTTNATMQYTVIAFNAASDIWFAIDPLPLVYALQMKLAKRLRIMLLMASRLSVPLFIIGQIMAVRVTEQSTDKTWTRATQSIWEMIVISTSVVCSIIPRTQKFWGLLQSGGLRVTDDSAIELSGVGSGRKGSASVSADAKKDSKRRSVQIIKERLEAKQISNTTMSRASQDSQEQFFPQFQQGFGKTTAVIHARDRPSAGSEMVEDFVNERPSNAILQTKEVTLRRD